MTRLEELEEACAACGVGIERAALPENMKAIYYTDPDTRPVIVINENICSQSDQYGIIAEELGHHYTTTGNLLSDKTSTKASVRKQEIIARRWAFKYTVSLSGIVEAHQAGARSLHEMAEHMGIEGRFLKEALESYEMIYGKSTEYAEHTVHFDPVSVQSTKLIPILGIVYAG